MYTCANNGKEEQHERGRRNESGKWKQKRETAKDIRVVRKSTSCVPCRLMYDSMIKLKNWRRVSSNDGQSLIKAKHILFQFWNETSNFYYQSPRPPSSAHYSVESSVSFLNYPNFPLQFGIHGAYDTYYINYCPATRRCRFLVCPFTKFFIYNRMILHLLSDCRIMHLDPKRN